VKDLRSGWNVLVVLLAFGITLGSNSATGAQLGRPASTSLVAGNSTIGFGSVAVGSSSALSDYIFNPTSSSITVTGATSSNADFEISQPKLPVTIGPRTWTRFVVSFTPQAAVAASGTIVLDNSGAAPLTLSVSGSGKTAGSSGGGTTLGGIVPSPTQIGFGTVALGGSQAHPVSLTNSGSTTLLISQATSSTSDFSVSGLGLPLVLAPNGSVSFSVTFAPKAAGTRSGSIALTGSTALAPGTFGRHGTPETASIAVTGVGGAQSSGGSTTTTPTPGSLTSGGSLSFGTLTVGSSTQKTATITNSGGSSVTVSNATVSGSGFTMAGMGMPMTLAPNASMNVNITCAPPTAGTLSGSLTVNSNASNASLSVPLSVTAVTPGTLAISPTSFSFGSVPAGSTQSLPASVTNTGGTSVLISQATFNGAGYSISGLTLPLSLAAGQSAPFNIVFAPQSAGTDNFILSISSNASNPTLTAAVSGSAAGPGALSASAPSLSFGSITVGNSKSLPETLTNSGGSSITVTQAAAGAGYTVTGLSLPQTLAAGGSTSFSVVFAPQSAVSSSVNLVVTTSNPVSTLTIPLSGTGITSGILSVNPVSFGSVQVGNSSKQTATLTNTGGSSLTVSSATLTGSQFGMSGLSMPLTLTAGQAFTFDVSFTPTTPGSATGTIALASDAASSPSIALSGTATAAGQFSVSPTSFSFGSVTVGTSKNLPVTLSATGASVNVTAAAVSNGTEFALTGPSLPLTIAAGGTASFTLTFDPQATGATTANVSFTSSASTSPVTETATGTGAAAAPVQHSVALSWSPSSSSVNGYNVYRGTVSGGPYTKINASLDTTTSYTDSTVQSGQTYFYVTTAVGTDGVESSYSNQVTAVVPTP